MVIKLKIFCRLSSNTVDLQVTLCQVLDKSKKLGRLLNTDFDMCRIISTSRFFVINKIKLDLRWKNYQHYYPELASEKLIKVIYRELF